MKCPLCSAWSQVVATREAAHNALRRRRLCANGHKFTTFEVVPEAVSRRELQASAKTQLQRAKLWRRDEAIRKDPRPATQVAMSYGLTEARIRQIRAGGSGRSTSRKKR